MEREKRKKQVITCIVLIIMSLIYLSSGKGQEALGLKIISAGFMAGAVFLYLRSRPLKDYHYLLPVNRFLAIAEKRHQYIATKDLLFIVPILIILGIGGGIHFICRLMHYTDHFRMLLVIWVVFYAAICLFGFYAGRKQWKKKYGQLWLEIRSFRESIENESDTDKEQA